MKKQLSVQYCTRRLYVYALNGLNAEYPSTTSQLYVKQIHTLRSKSPPSSRLSTIVTILWHHGRFSGSLTPIVDRDFEIGI
jgi:hypothetical protein